MRQEEKNMRTLYLPNAETWVLEENDLEAGSSLGLTGLRECTIRVRR